MCTIDESSTLSGESSEFEPVNQTGLLLWCDNGVWNVSEFHTIREVSEEALTLRGDTALGRILDEKFNIEKK